MDARGKSSKIVPGPKPSPPGLHKPLGLETRLDRPAEVGFERRSRRAQLARSHAGNFAASKCVTRGSALAWKWRIAF